MIIELHISTLLLTAIVVFIAGIAVGMAGHPGGDSR